MEQTSQQMLMKFPGEATYKLSSDEFSLGLWEIPTKIQHSAEVRDILFYFLVD